MSSGAQARWRAIESEPSVFTEMLGKLGMPPQWQFVEVFGLDEELLAFIPGPVQALILCFAHKEGSAREPNSHASGGPLFVRQLPSLGNACGTIACIHSVLNSDRIELENGPLLDFAMRTAGDDAQRRGEKLERDERIQIAHSAAAVQGSGGADAGAEDVDYHYVAFVHKSGTLYELDGMASGPIAHGPCTPETLLHDAARVVRAQYTDANVDGNFALMALTGAED